MDVRIVYFPTDKIADWDSFHNLSQAVFGFPDFYGRNMDAWIDCMTSPDADDGMMATGVSAGGLLVIRVDNSGDFARRCPEQFSALVECTAFVNYRRAEVGEPAILALMLVGHH